MFSRRHAEPDESTQMLADSLEALADTPPSQPPDGQPERRQRVQREEDKIRDIGGSTAAVFLIRAAMQHFDEFLEKNSKRLMAIVALGSGLIYVASYCGAKNGGPQAQMDTIRGEVGNVRSDMKALRDTFHIAFDSMTKNQTQMLQGQDSANKIAGKQLELACWEFYRSDERAMPEFCRTALENMGVISRRTTGKGIRFVQKKAALISQLQE